MIEIACSDLVDTLFTKLVCYPSAVCYLFTFWFNVTTLVFCDTSDVALFIYCSLLMMRNPKKIGQA